MSTGLHGEWNRRLPNIIDSQVNENQIRILGNMLFPASCKVIASDATLGSIHKLGHEDD